MPRLKCPDCKKIQTIKGKYDNMFDTKLTYKYCGFTVNGWCWEYIAREKKEEFKAIKFKIFKEEGGYNV